MIECEPIGIGSPYGPIMCRCGNELYIRNNIVGMVFGDQVFSASIYGSEWSSDPIGVIHYKEVGLPYFEPFGRPSFPMLSPIEPFGPPSFPMFPPLFP